MTDHTCEPPNDIRLARLNQLADEAADLFDDAVKMLMECMSLGVPPENFVDMVGGRLDPAVSTAALMCYQGAYPRGIYLNPQFKSEPVTDKNLVDQNAAVMTHFGAARSMYSLIARLFAEAPKMTDASGKEDPTQAPALPCHVVLRGSVPPFEGVLSTTPEGTLRLLTPSKISATKTVMIEMFFDYADVVSIALQRDVTGTEASRIHIA